MTDVERFDWIAEIDVSGGDILERKATLLVMIRQDANPVVRHEAAFALGRIAAAFPSSADEILAVVCDCAVNDVSALVRHEAVEVLGHFVTTIAVETVDRLCADAVDDVRATAVLGRQRQALLLRGSY